MVSKCWLQKLGAITVIAVLCGCSTRTYVSTTGSTPPQYTHVFLTVKEVWINGVADAQPGDGGWSKFTLSDPVTVDLVSASNGTLVNLIGALRLVPGDYAQIRLIPVDNAYGLTASAQALGATYNNEVDYVDAGNLSHQLPLEILNPDNGIAAQGSLNVPVGGTTPSANTSSSTSSTGTTGLDTSGAAVIGLGTNAGPTNLYFTVNFNGATDIALFTYGSQIAAVLNSHAQAFDLSKSGGISGTLTLTNIGNITNPSARLNISATAETFSSDGSRHVAVISAPVHSDGTFLLYPLPASDSTKNPTKYDVVIHGAGIETIIIKGVQVARSNVSSSSSSSAMSVGTASASIGTLIPQSAASYGVNLAPLTSLPSGAFVSLHQTLPGSGEVPYVIERSAIDPFNNTLQLDVPVANANVQVGTYTTDGQAITLTTATPVEGTGAYSAAADATFFAAGPFNVIAAPPSSGTITLISPVAPSLASGISSVAMTAIVTQRTAGAYDHGQLIVSRDGTIVATAAIDPALASATGGTITVNGIPGGSSTVSYAAGVYDVTVRVWNSQDPAGTLQRQYFPAIVDVRNGNVTGVSIAIN